MSARAHPGDDSQLEPTCRLLPGPAEGERTSRLQTPVRPPDVPDADSSHPRTDDSGWLFTPTPDQFPRPGDRFLHFELVEELGRGSFARVYLARQESLANRLVALKVTTAPTDEPQKLARLQHTNVVPVYSVHDTGRLQALCMPFLGRVTLARMMSHLASRGGSQPQSGSELLSTLQSDSRAPLGDPKPAPAAAPDAAHPGPAEVLRMLAGMSFADAVLWLLAQLAAGLAHAHSRGILHRDLKPANVLVTADGVPMILDFNVSSESARASAEGRIGGTLPYMAPEHIRAFAGEDTIVDERSDLYSLGVLLYELLTGRRPYPEPREPNPEAALAAMVIQRRSPPPRPGSIHPAVTPAVDAIVLKLLDPDPDRRYQRADDLREDLTRQLANRPLRFAHERSVRERVRKWRRRNPRAFAGLAVATLALVFLILPAGVIAARQSEMAARAREVQRAEAVVGYTAAADELRTAAVLLNSRSDPGMRDQGFGLARQVLDRYGVDADPAWESRPGFARLDPDQQADLKAALAETLVLMTRAEGRKGGYSPEAVDAALRWNATAARLFPADARPAVLARHREELEHRRAGKPVPRLTPKPESFTDTELYFDALDLIAEDRYPEALPLLTRFCERHPKHFQAWFARGACHDALGQTADAATAFAVCVALRPDFPHAHLNRGLAHYKLRRYADAEADLTRALKFKPGWTVALLNRGLARDGLRQYAEAEADYTAALADPTAPTRVYFLRAKSRRALNNTAGYEADRAEGMRREPADALSYSVRGTWRMEAKEFAAALADFDAALRLNPNAREALLNKGIVLADKLHREADAIPVFDRFLELYPDHVDARCSRGVYLARLGRADGAKRDAADALKVDRSAYRLFQVAGLYAQLSKADPAAKDEALKYLGRALRAGFNNAELLRTDPDLDPIRKDPGFARLMAAVGQLDKLGQ